MHENFNIIDIRFVDEQQKIVELCTEQLSSLQTEVTNFPK